MPLWIHAGGSVGGEGVAQACGERQEDMQLVQVDAFPSAGKSEANSVQDLSHAKWVSLIIRRRQGVR